MSDFPTATPLKIFDIGGSLYRRVTLSEGSKNPDAVRAIVGRTSRSEGQVAFFAPFDPFEYLGNESTDTEAASS
jgi:hypothetical protein